MFHFRKFVHQQLIKVQGLGAWEDHNSLHREVPSSLVYSKVEQVIKNERIENEKHQQLINFIRKCVLLRPDPESSYFSAYFGPVKS